QNGKIAAGEMEAAGFATACDKHKTDWLVVRGISDFGDKFKTSAFFVFAAKSAAVVLCDLIRHALCLDYDRPQTVDRIAVTSTPQVTKTERDAPAWQGIEWEDTFIAYSGPLVKLPEIEAEA